MDREELAERIEFLAEVKNRKEWNERYEDD